MSSAPKAKMQKNTDKKPNILQQQHSTKKNSNLSEQSTKNNSALSEQFLNDDTFYESNEPILENDSFNNAKSPVSQVSQSGVNVINEIYHQMNTDSTKRRKKTDKYSKLVSNILPKV